MTSVVSNIFVSPRLPGYLSPIGEEVRKSLCYAFEDDAVLNRFVDGTSERLKTLSHRKSSKVSLTMDDRGTSIEITIGSLTPLITMTLIRIKGHVHVSQDGTSLFPQDFIEEGGGDGV